MSEVWRKSRWLVMAAAVAALLALGLSRLGAPEMPRDPLAAAPVGSSVVARIDVGAVVGSHLWAMLLEQDDEEAGVRQIERVCGYDPLEQVEEAVVFASGSDARPFERVGFMARGEMARGDENRRRLMACVGDVVGRQGGAVRRVEVEGEAAIASASGGSHAAFLGADAVVGGDRAVVAQAIRVARGDAPSALDDATLRRLWARVAAQRDVVVVAHLPRRWTPALRRLARGLGGELAALSSVRALGIGARVRDGLSLGIAAETASASQAARLERAVQDQADALLGEPAIRLSVVGRALRRLRVEAQGREVIVTLSLTDAQLDALLELWRELRSSRAEATRREGAGEDGDAEGAAEEAESEGAAEGEVEVPAIEGAPDTPNRRGELAD